MQPIVLLHTREVLDSKTLKATPGVVKVIYLQAVHAEKGSSWFIDAENSMKEAFYKELNS